MPQAIIIIACGMIAMPKFSGNFADSEYNFFVHITKTELASTPITSDSTISTPVTSDSGITITIRQQCIYTLCMHLIRGGGGGGGDRVGGDLLSIAIASLSGLS